MSVADRRKNVRQVSERRKTQRTAGDHPLWWHTLHRMWTRRVGKPGYDQQEKQEWFRLEQQIKQDLRDERRGHARLIRSDDFRKQCRLFPGSPSLPILKELLEYIASVIEMERP